FSFATDISKGRIRAAIDLDIYIELDWQDGEPIWYNGVVDLSASKKCAAFRWPPSPNWSAGEQGQLWHKLDRARREHAKGGASTSRSTGWAATVRLINGARRRGRSSVPAGRAGWVRSRQSPIGRSCRRSSTLSSSAFILRAWARRRMSPPFRRPATPAR